MVTSFFAVLPLVCMPPCSAHATFKENNMCEGNLNSEGDGITCTGRSHPCMGGIAARGRSRVALGQGAWAPSRPFCFPLGLLRQSHPLCDSVSSMGLLMPDLPTSQVMTLKLLCQLRCTLFYGIFVTLQIIQSYFKKFRNYTTVFKKQQRNLHMLSPLGENHLEH